MIHIDELLENLDRLDEDIHIVSNIYGHEIFPKPNLFIDWVLPVITHAPTLSFYHMLEMYHSQDKTQEFYSLQKIFETKWTLFTPIISWKPSCTSTILDQNTLDSYEKKLETNSLLLQMIRWIMSSSQRLK